MLKGALHVHVGSITGARILQHVNAHCTDKESGQQHNPSAFLLGIPYISGTMKSQGGKRAGVLPLNGIFVPDRIFFDFTERALHKRALFRADGPEGLCGGLRIDHGIDIDKTV